MTALTDHIANVKEWIDDYDPADSLVTQWTRFAEERMNNELRTQEQVVRDYATMDDNCVALPLDYLELVYVRLKGGRPFNYVTPDAYFKFTVTPMVAATTEPNGEVWPFPGTSYQSYTIIGLTLFVWPPIDPTAATKVEIAYTRKITPTGDFLDPVLSRYGSIFLNCTLSAASPYLVEDERMSTFGALATASIEKANNAAKAARWSGSPLAPVLRSFG